MANNLKQEKKVAVISMLCEGASIRAIERITGVNQNTIMSLSKRVGTACKRIMDEKMRNLTCKQIEVDEIWGFIGAKQRNARKAKAYGDVWTFIALDADTKLIPSFTIGKRDSYHAKAFMSDLAGRVANRVQISSDALAAYEDAIERGFGSEVDYGQIVKTYSLSVPGNAPANVRHSPSEVVQVEKTVIAGMFDLTGHPKTKRAYAWSHLDKPDDSEERFVAVLQIPPVESAITAVRALIMADAKRKAGGS